MTHVPDCGNIITLNNDPAARGQDPAAAGVQPQATDQRGGVFHFGRREGAEDRMSWVELSGRE